MMVTQALSAFYAAARQAPIAIVKRVAATHARKISRHLAEITPNRGQTVTTESKLAKYVRQRKHMPHGWLARTDAEILQAIMEAQRLAGMAGSAVEIGVHHGKSMIALCLGLAPGEKAYAIDVFEQQHLNKDQSGSGNRQMFEKNLIRFGAPGDTVTIDPRSSEEVKPEDIMRAVGPARIFSVDGGHWAEIVKNDLHLAEGAIAPHGVIVLDDFHRAEWPDVSAGYFAWFGERRKPLVAFAIGFNKLYLCEQTQVGFYQKALASCQFLRLFLAKEVVFQGVKIPVYHRLLFPEMGLKAGLLYCLMLFRPDYYARLKS
jgi:hypothetical protein